MIHEGRKTENQAVGRERVPLLSADEQVVKHRETHRRQNGKAGVPVSGAMAGTVVYIRGRNKQQIMHDMQFVDPS
jgi:hypothetical protein